MDKLKYHGLVLIEENKCELRFGIVNLIHARSSLAWIGNEISEDARKAIKRFHKRAYWQCDLKMRDTASKLNEAMYKLGISLKILEEKDKYLYDGAPIEKAAIFGRAHNDISYDLDSFIMYLRILADCISFALPFFYKTKEKIKSSSFREHKKWFQTIKPKFDPDYTKILNAHSKWFELLAGNESKGIRDLQFHNFGIYQLTWTALSGGSHQITISQVGIKGVVRSDVLLNLVEAILDFFEYLDAVYELFGIRFNEEIPSINRDLEQRSIMMGLEMPDIRSKYRLYPIINV